MFLSDFFMNERTLEILKILEERFPDAKSELVYNSDYQLLVAVVLSAQCTDKRVNQVTEKLFKVAGTPQDMLKLSIGEIESYIFSCGFYKHKAKFLHDLSFDIVNRFNGQVPKTKAELESLAGVGKKTANVVYAVAFDGQAIAVDTHVFRVSNRLGISSSKTVEICQKHLEQAIPPELWSKSHHWLLLFGRYICKSQNPNCGDCPVTQYCKFIDKGV